jgi:ATPase subunit of ABC transporter with duplicated ATPase domains
MYMPALTTQAKRRKCETRRKASLQAYRQQEELMNASLNHRRDAVRQVEKREKQAEKLRKVQVASQKLIYEQQHDLEVLTKDAEAKTPELVINWDGDPIPLKRSDTRDKLTKTIIQLKAKVGRVLK